MSRKHYLSVMLVLVFWATLVFHPATAQSPRPGANAIELVGTIQAFDGTTLTVNGQRISVIGAELNVVPAVGIAVKVEGSIASDGSLVAREVNAAAATDIQPGEVELIGTVTALQSGQVTVNSQVIDIASAEVKAGVAVGQIVKIEGTTNAQGQLVAREVNVVSAASQTSGRNETTIKGTLDAIGDGFIVVSGQQFSTTNAEITTTLTVGALVEVKVAVVNGQAQAREVEAGHAETETEVNDVNDDNGSNGDGADDPAGDQSGSSSSGNSGKGSSGASSSGLLGTATNITGSNNSGSDNSGSGSSGSSDKGGSGGSGSDGGTSGGKGGNGGSDSGSNDGGGHH